MEQFGMGSNKRFGPDGLTINFYKNYWGIIKEAVVKEIQNTFQSRTIKKAYNHTFLVLIPKTDCVAKADQFKPIALCNVFLKIVTKIVATRIRKHLDNLIHPCQSAFISHRAIQDNIIINHEVMHFLKGKKGSKGYMAIKIDLAKTYDRVERKMLIHMLFVLGFEKKFTDLIHSCISSPLFSILINGVPFGYFKAERGIRQGGPMSPGLFTAFSDLLFRILARAEHEGKISGIKISRCSPRVTHLMYADDLVIYCKADLNEDKEVINCLQLYCSWIGQAINWNKSSIHFNSNVNSQLRGEITRAMNIQDCLHKGKYLGHPFFQLKSKTEAYKTVMERLENKLSGWRKKTLSMAGRLVLVKAVTNAIPSFVMQVILLPKEMLTKMDKRTRGFLWGHSEDKAHHFHPKSWATVCQSKEGGLIVKRMVDINMASITKLHGS